MGRLARRGDGGLPHGDTHVARRAKMQSIDAVGKLSRRVDREALRIETQVTRAMTHAEDAEGKLSRRVDREALRIETQVTRARMHAEDAVGTPSRRVDREVLARSRFTSPSP